MLRQLRVLLLTIIASIGAFGWSIILLLLFKVAYAIVLTMVLSQYILDPSNDFDDRKWVNKHYGDFFTTMYSMFEITYSGS
eukprot:CAMPEP_0197678852 /NCGR_PEP_ID=MMETSP1338-20131121/90722_1 /TAXON_ID=43686 ORGANISM="Pelagodinium beii, Strain RCC1491" /NCGR_SAMPLE_ID=MMETSP1338 /ASSEMBLY_ACC=CAM_ASM_000754 /LENGTH=80 /DNA_ID=CAMNT_0043259837 /DNA_START=62 /DNA_END=301 /DNA_ORIENTATION=-